MDEIHGRQALSLGLFFFCCPNADMALRIKDIQKGRCQSEHAEGKVEKTNKKISGYTGDQ